MKFQLQTVNYVHFFIKAASIKFWTVKGSKGGTYVRIYILTFTCMWKFRLIFKIGRKLRVTEGIIPSYVSKERYFIKLFNMGLVISCNGNLLIHTYMTTEMKASTLHVVTLQVCLQVCFQVCF